MYRVRPGNLTLSGDFDILAVAVKTLTRLPEDWDFTAETISTLGFAKPLTWPSCFGLITTSENLHEATPHDGRR